MPKFISPKFSSVFKKLGKKPPSSSSPSLVQQQPSRPATQNPTPSLARDPLADRSATEAASLIAYNLATSVGAPTSNDIPSRSESALTSRSVAKDTAVNALKLLLKIASDIPGPGIKPALSGLLTIIERVQETSGNVQGFENLARRMENLRSIFSMVKEMEIGARVDVVGFLEKLEVEVKSLSTEIEQATSRGTLIRFFNSTDDASSLKSHNDSLDRIISEANFLVAIDTHHGVGHVEAEIKLLRVQTNVVTTADERQKIFTWLSTSVMVPNNNYDGALEQCLKNTASWIFEKDFFVRWKQGEDSVLCLVGKCKS